jgi:hypothetical protein
MFLFYITGNNAVADCIVQVGNNTAAGTVPHLKPKPLNLKPICLSPVQVSDVCVARAAAEIMAAALCIGSEALALGQARILAHHLVVLVDSCPHCYCHPV